MYGAEPQMRHHHTHVFVSVKQSRLMVDAGRLLATRSALQAGWGPAVRPVGGVVIQLLIVVLDVFLAVEQPLLLQPELLLLMGHVVAPMAEQLVLVGLPVHVVLCTGSVETQLLTAVLVVRMVLALVVIQIQVVRLPLVHLQPRRTQHLETLRSLADLASLLCTRDCCQMDV